MRAMILPPWVLLLAAGGSRRYGSPKLVARLDGESLLRRAAHVALGCGSAGCTVVLGANAIRLERELRGLPVGMVINRHWRRGLSSSLRAGLAALPATAPAVLVMLADQAALKPQDLERLIAAWCRQPRMIVAARAGDMLGPPAIFPRQAFRELRRLHGDAGAKALLRNPSRRVIEIGIDNAAYDVDRPEDLDRRSITPVVW
jgi:CTP:molybdopterin cytidylyltransferase MocA